MLINPSPSTITSMNNPRQIAAYSTTGSAVMYTVPAGKKFVGYVNAGPTSGLYTVTPSGGVAVTFISFPVNASIGNPPVPLTFVAGTVITSAGGDTYLIGVESDL